MAKKRKQWAWLPASRAAGSAPDTATKAQVEAKARALIDVLKTRHVKPPPEEALFNYVTDITLKWHGPWLYFVAIYACPGPNALSPSFEERFARMRHAGGDRFDLAFTRHTGQWVELFKGLPADECLKAIRDDPLFHP